MHSACPCRRRPVLLIAILVSASFLLSSSQEALAQQARRKPLAGPVKGKLSKDAKVNWGRQINPAHPLRKQVGAEALLKATLSLMDGGDLHSLPRHLRRALVKLSGKPQRALRKPKVQTLMLKKLKDQLGERAFELHAGKRASALREALQLLNDTPSPDKDLRDMQRGWGWKLLPENDPAFSDPKYLSSMLRESGQTGAGHYINTAPTRALERFEEAWKKIAPEGTSPVAFTLTGSDANNLLYDVARKAAEKRLGKEVERGEILYFEGVYGGVRGPIQVTSFLGPSRSEGRALAITSPHSPQWRPTDPAEIRRLERLESEALGQIRDKVQNSGRPIGGVFIEPILGAKGVYFYRPEFMKKLRALCDELRVPIFADEILTGGGRTGKFFAYQHYEGFKPDLVTFGKGLQVAGIAIVERESAIRAHYLVGSQGTTLKAHAEPLLKGAQVLNRIREDNLMENAERMGKRILEKLREGGGGSKNPEHQSRGMGLLIYSKTARGRGLVMAMGRMMPYLSISEKEVDRLFASNRPSKRQQRKARMVPFARTEAMLHEALNLWGEATETHYDKPYSKAISTIKEAERWVAQARTEGERSGSRHLMDKVEALEGRLAATKTRLTLEYAEHNLDEALTGKIDGQPELKVATARISGLLDAPPAPLTPEQHRRAIRVAHTAPVKFADVLLSRAQQAISNKNLAEARGLLEQVHKLFKNESEIFGITALLRSEEVGQRLRRELTARAPELERLKGELSALEAKARPAMADVSEAARPAPPPKQGPVPAARQEHGAVSPSPKPERRSLGRRLRDALSGR